MTTTQREAVLRRLRASDRPMTAKELGTTSKLLRRCPEVQIVGERRTGGRGRPAMLFEVSG